MIIDQHDKKRVKELFSNWLDIRDQRQQLNDTNKDVVKEVADILNVQSKTVNKLFAFLKQKQDNGDDELDTLLDLAASIEN
jgi:uncharacterized coiled-coil DUF342 family protein